MKLTHTLMTGAMTMLLAAPAFADTFVGKVVYVDAEDKIVEKGGEVELTPAQIDAIKLKIEGKEHLADKIKVKTFEGENRKVVLAVFRDVADMPEGSALIVKGSLLEGTNGKLFYGDVFTRECESEGHSVTGQDGEDTLLDQVMDSVQTIQDLTGCETQYRGGILLAHKTDR